MIKLPTILTPMNHGAFLLIGFDLVDQPMAADIAELIQRAELHEPLWTTLSRSWTNPFDSRHRSHCWFWYRLGS
jgi:hypothetical protein